MVFFFFFFLAILAKYFPDARLSPEIKCGLVVLMKSIIFSGNSILFLDFSYLLSTFFLHDDAFASPAPVVFSDSLTKTTIWIPLRCLSLKFAVNGNRFTANWLKSS